MTLFVTGTDTGVGKTHTVVQILRLLRAKNKSCAGYKPICCGDRADAELLLGAGSAGLTIGEINPLWLKTPTAPFVAAEIEQVQIKIESLLQGLSVLQTKVEHVIVEGVGGWLVPIHQNYFASDLAAAMCSDVLIVAQNRLGCLNHALLTVQNIKGHELACTGVVLNTPPEVKELAVSTNARVLRSLIDVPVVEGLASDLTEFPAEWLRILGGFNLSAGVV